jgi:hypothetical protein
MSRSPARKLSREILAAAVLTGTLLVAATASAGPSCMIFVHGKRDGAAGADYNLARDYWISGSRDFIQTATAGFSTPHYVVAYHGDKPYWDAESAGAVASQIVDAVAGLPDGGGNSCSLTGGRVWVIAHSMGGNILDYILGNADPSSPNYNANGPYDTAASLISLVMSVSGSHRGSELADAVCGGSGFLCNLGGSIFQDCGPANYWLRSDASVQVASAAGPPAKNVYLTGGYEAIFGASLCLSGEDDGVVQHASQYACAGDPTTAYDNDDVCGNTSKQEVSGFLNLDVGHENHSDTHNDADRDTRRAIPTGYWKCNGSPCTPGSQVQSDMSSAQLVETLAAANFGGGRRCGLGFELVLIVPLLAALHRRRRA